MPDFAQNLAAASARLKGHRDACGPCNCDVRFANGAARGNRLAATMPLSNGSSSEKDFKAIWADQEIKSQRVVHKEHATEVELGTDNDVFLFVGSLRYFRARCGILFSSELERHFPRAMSATPFDSGGLVKHFTAKSGGTPRVAFESMQLPVPGYRNYLGEFVATLFDPPDDYYLGTGIALCQEPIVISGGNDLLRRTFEVRFAERLPLNAHILAVFLPRVLAQEEWAHEVDKLHSFGTENSQDYDQLVEATAKFIAELFPAEAA